MSRLQQDLQQIDRLTIKADSREELPQKLLLIALVIGICLYNVLHNPDPNAIALEKLIGPLASFQVVKEDENRVACRTATCTFEYLQPKLTQIRQLREVRYLAPPTQVLTPPAGRVFRSTRSSPFNWFTSHVKEPDGFLLLRLSGINDPVNSRYGPESREAVMVPSQGYVRRAKLIGKSEQVATDGTVSDDSINNKYSYPLADYSGAEGHSRLNSENPMFDRIEFQPFDFTMRFALNDSSGLELQPGDPAILYLDAPPSTTTEEGGPDENYSAIPLQVVQLDLSHSPPTVQMKIMLEQPELLLRRRIHQTQYQGKSAFPENMWLNFTPHYQRAAGQLLQIPATALVHDKQDTLVWLALDDMAIPLRVVEVDRKGADVVITEAVEELTRGLPIRVADWFALTGYQRGRLWQVVSNRNKPDMNRLLRAELPIIANPDSQLRSGTPIRGKAHG